MVHYWLPMLYYTQNRISICNIKNFLPVSVSLVTASFSSQSWRGSLARSIGEDRREGEGDDRRQGGRRESNHFEIACGGREGGRDEGREREREREGEGERGGRGEKRERGERSSVICGVGSGMWTITNLSKFNLEHQNRVHIHTYTYTCTRALL